VLVIKGLMVFLGLLGLVCLLVPTGLFAFACHDYGPVSDHVFAQ
jgi:hypothetical protein